MKKERINLIPVELRPSLQSTLKALPKEAAPVAALGILILYVFASTIQIQWSTRLKRRELASLNDRNTTLRQDIDQLSDLNKRASQESDKLKSVQEVLSKKGYWSDIFKELSLIIPEKVWLTAMSTAGDGAEKKLILKGEATSQSLVADFFSSLEKSQTFSKASMNYSEREPKIQPTLYKFEFSIPFPEARIPEVKPIQKGEG